MGSVALHPGHILVYSADEAQRILSEHTTNELVSDAMSVKDWSVHHYHIGAISTAAESITAVVLMRRSHRLRTTTDKYRVFFVSIVQFAPISLEELATKKMLGVFNEHSQLILNKMPPNQWHTLIQAIKALRPQSKIQIQRLEKLLTTPIPIGEERSSNSWITAGLERDALHTALQISGFPSMVLPSVNSTKPSRVLHHIAADKTEQAMLIHDMAQGLQGWQLENINAKGLYAARFRDNHRILTVLNVNTTTLEQTLGVDLIYYRHDLNSYLLIQYKRMRRNARNQWIYYPEGSYEKEYETMAKLSEKIKPVSSQSLVDYRFNHQWNYFKFCPIDGFDVQSNQATRGYYIPFDFWQQYEQSNESRGERGGLRFTHDVAHLDTHSFTHLVKVGWIGSQGSVSDEIGAIIREKLNPKRHHSVIIAALSQETAGQQHMQFEPLIQ